MTNPRSRWERHAEGVRFRSVRLRGACGPCAQTSGADGSFLVPATRIGGVPTRSERGGAAVIDLFCGHYTFDAGAGAVLFRSLPDPVHVSFGLSTDGDQVLWMLSALMRGEAQREGKGTAAILSALSTAPLALVLRSTGAPP